VGHHLLLAHATAAHIYQTEFEKPHQHQHHGGHIGMSNCGDYRYPSNPDLIQDQEAAERAMLFQMGWFTDPLIFGDYPSDMRRILGDRLPQFTTAEQELLLSLSSSSSSTTKHPIHFIGLNHYSTLLAAAPTTIPTYGGYWADVQVDYSNHPNWTQTSMGWNVVPQGCRDMLLWISQRYPNMTIYITENGISDNDDDEPQPRRQDVVSNTSTMLFNDANRISYLHGYLQAVKEAVDLNVPVGGYFVWSLMDNFEWQFGYQRKFGMVHVDFDENTLARTPKQSALWYRNVIHEQSIKGPLVK
jgi:beta-glucosidase/6-phospho-beta-glucosidase/beta-galactosidase